MQRLMLLLTTTLNNLVYWTSNRSAAAAGLFLYLGKERSVEDVWHRLQKTSLPIVMYGTGNGADKLLDAFAQYGIPVSDIFVSDKFYRGQEFRGYTVLRYEDIQKKYSDCIIVLAFAIFRPDMLQIISSIRQNYEVLAPEMPVFGNNWFTGEYMAEHEQQIARVRNILADEKSKDVYDNLIQYRLTGELTYLDQATTPREEVFEDILHLGPEEIYVDLGAYRGDTIEEFLTLTGGQYRKIIALEPDEKNFRKLQKATEGMENVELYPLASWSEQKVLHFDGGGGRNSSLNTGNQIAHTTDLDSLLHGDTATYVKMDVEGADKETLQGMKNTLKQYRPKLAVSAYHRTEDLFFIPDLILSENSDYEIFLRHHPYIPAWETNFYCR